MKELLKKLFGKKEAPVEQEPYDFNASNPLGGNGERVDITFSGELQFERLDMYQKNHFRRYEYALGLIPEGVDVADLACGTGYGSMMLAQKANSVVGADLNGEVISAISERYKDHEKVRFMEANLLHLDFEDVVDVVVSFETIEHFKESDISTLLGIFHRALKPGGSLIFSTPYNQEDSEEARKLGFHLTFNIVEEKIEAWLEAAGFEPISYKYQDYQSHEVRDKAGHNDFILTHCRKK